MQASLERLRQRRAGRGDEGGFTLIELLIVIVILGILAAIVVFAVQNLTGESAQAACGSDFKTVETAAETYKAQTGEYPGGSTLFSGVTLTASTTSGLTPGIADLMGTATQGSNTLGPWLKDNPVNQGHYSIQVSTDGKGTVQVYDATGGATIPATGTGTAADCSSVK